MALERAKASAWPPPPLALPSMPSCSSNLSPPEAEQRARRRLPREHRRGRLATAECLPPGNSADRVAGLHVGTPELPRWEETPPARKRRTLSAPRSRSMLLKLARYAGVHEHR